jgi:hypothetical protein
MSKIPQHAQCLSIVQHLDNLKTHTEKELAYLHFQLCTTGKVLPSKVITDNFSTTVNTIQSHINDVWAKASTLREQLAFQFAQEKRKSSHSCTNQNKRSCLTLPPHQTVTAAKPESPAPTKSTSTGTKQGPDVPTTATKPIATSSKQGGRATTRAEDLWDTDIDDATLSDVSQHSSISQQSSTFFPLTVDGNNNDTANITTSFEASHDSTPFISLPPPHEHNISTPKKMGPDQHNISTPKKMEPDQDNTSTPKKMDQLTFTAALEIVSQDHPIDQNE